MKIVHVITSLSTGGAETALLKLLSNMDRSRFDSEVISLTDIGPIGEKIEAMGIPVSALGMTRGVPNPIHLLRLMWKLRVIRSEIVQTWMYHSDLLGGLAAWLAGLPVVWNIRHGNLDPGANKRLTILIARLLARMSWWLPKKIVCCAETASTLHTALGYCADKMTVIPNGFQLIAFRPDLEARLQMRLNLAIPADALVVGTVGRFDKQKDHRTLVQAAGMIRTVLPDVHFVLCGEGMTSSNLELSTWIESAGIRDHLHLLGVREDIPGLMPAFDVFALSSLGEGFPNVVGEAMASGVPCVVTEAGDAPMIVGDTGKVVPCKNPSALAVGIIQLLTQDKTDREALGRLARRRVEDRFRIESIARQYEDLYQSLVAKPASLPPGPASI